MELSSFVVLAGLLALSEASPRSRPNFLFVVTNDQYPTMNSVEYMPHVESRIRDKGINFTTHFVTTALCCPSRVSLWTTLHTDLSAFLARNTTSSMQSGATVTTSYMTQICASF
ncbi:hypothetical protein BDV10DRAFT_23135 [Aspergillus recurvatus]